MIHSISIETPLGQMYLSASKVFLISAGFVKTEKHPDFQVVEEGQKTAILKETEQQLTQYFEGKRQQFQLPLGQKGTDFQQTVWKKLEEIPFGKTQSYLEMAKRLGDVKSIRAAASANGKNNIAIIVPCHRVIGADGKLVGYAGDLWRKKWLLEHEEKFSDGDKQLRLF